MLLIKEYKFIKEKDRFKEKDVKMKDHRKN